MTRPISLASLPPKARAAVMRSPQYRASAVRAEQVSAKKSRADRGGFDSYAEREFSLQLTPPFRYHWLRVQLDGGTVWTPDFVRIPSADSLEFLGVASLTICRSFGPRDWIAYEVQAAPWRLANGQLGRHQSKRGQSIVLREIRAAFPWLRIVKAEKLKGGGFAEKEIA